MYHWIIPILIYDSPCEVPGTALYVMNESHLSRVFGTNSHAKFSPNEGVIDEICNILKVLSIVLTERQKIKTDLDAVVIDIVEFLSSCHPPFTDFIEALKCPLNGHMPQGNSLHPKLQCRA